MSSHGAFERGRMGTLRAAGAAVRRGLVAGTLALVFGGCTLEPARAGDACQRSTECPLGLACVRGRCTSDLGPVAAESTVPEIVDAPASGADAAAAVNDASIADGG